MEVGPATLRCRANRSSIRLEHDLGSVWRPSGPFVARRRVRRERGQTARRQIQPIQLGPACAIGLEDEFAPRALWEMGESGPVGARRRTNPVSSVMAWCLRVSRGRRNTRQRPGTRTRDL